MEKVNVLKKQTHSTIQVLGVVSLIEEKRKCIICRKEFLLNKYKPNAKCCSPNCNTRWWYRHNKERVFKYQKKYLCIDKNRKHRNETRKKSDIILRKRRRIEALNKLGNKCAICGFNDPRALQIDHVNGGGTREIKEKFKRNRNKYYQFILKDISNNYQLLCANCNWIKKYERNENKS